MANEVEQPQIYVDANGCLVINAPLWRELGLADGDILVTRLQEGALVLEKRSLIQQRLKARFSGLPKDRSLSNELIAERRAEASRELEA